MKKIPLTQSKVALVDDEDYEELMKYKWCACFDGHNWYAMRNRTKLEDGPVTLTMHVAIMGKKGVDHRDGDGLNNQRSNLRFSTQQQNIWNRRIPRDNTSGYKGVSRIQNSDKWRAYIHINSKQNYLGSFDSPIRAACAYDDAARRLHGEFARLNFPRIEDTMSVKVLDGREKDEEK